MFNKKELEKIDCQCQNTVNCSECGCLILKDKAQEVKYQLPYYQDKFYCGRCRKPYSRVDCDLPIMRGFDTKIHYYAELEVDKNGKPIK